MKNALYLDSEGVFRDPLQGQDDNIVSQFGSTSPDDNKALDSDVSKQLGLPNRLHSNGDSPLHAGLPTGKERDDKRAAMRSLIARQQSTREIVLTPDLEKQFWESSIGLQHIYRYAMLRGVEPWAAYGSAQSYGIAHIPPNWTFLPELGRRGSANTITLLVDDSGGGKGASTDCGHDAFSWPVPFRPFIDSPKSGPAFVKRFMGLKSRATNKAVTAIASAASSLYTPAGQAAAAAQSLAGSNSGEKEQVNFTAWFEYSEIADIDARASQSMKIIAMMCQVWSGEQLGGSALDDALSLMLEKGKYRICILAGVQLENTGMVLKHQSTGLPQRGLWLPAYSQQSAAKLDEAIDFMGLDLPKMDIAAVTDVTGFTVADIEDEIRHGTARPIAMPDFIKNTVHAEILARRYSRDQYDPLERHSGLTRMSNALFLSQLEAFHGASDIGFSELDYERAEVVMLKSREVRQRAIDAQETRKNEDLREHGRQQYIIQNTQKKLNRIDQARRGYQARAIQLTTEKPHEWVTYPQGAVKENMRPMLRQTLERMASAGEIEFRTATPRSGQGESLQIKTPTGWTSGTDDE